jgi:prevent-host-death family protein
VTDKRAIPPKDVQDKNVTGKQNPSATPSRKWNVKTRLGTRQKVIPLSEAKANLSQYARRCHDEPVIVTVNGVPSFQLVPLSEDDDLIDSLLEHNPAFRETLEFRSTTTSSGR